MARNSYSFLADRQVTGNLAGDRLWPIVRVLLPVKKSSIGILDHAKLSAIWQTSRDAASGHKPAFGNELAKQTAGHAWQCCDSTGGLPERLWHINRR